MKGHVKFTHIDTLSLKNYIYKHMDNSAVTRNYIYGLTSAHIGAFIIFIIILDVYSVKKFRNKQTAMLNIFRCLPGQIKNEKIANIDEVIDEDPLGFEDTISGVNLDEFNTVGMDSFRYQYIAYGISTITLAFIFAYLNISALNAIETIFFTRNTLGQVKTSAARAFVGLGELDNVDYVAWTSASNLMNRFTTDYTTVIKNYDHVMYGNDDPATRSPSISQFAFDQLDVVTTRCILENKTICQNQVYDPSIGFTSNLVSRGVVHVQDRFMWYMYGFYQGAKRNQYVSGSSELKLLNKIFEPYLLEGWKQVEAFEESEADRVMQYSLSFDKVILALEILVIIVGQFWVFTRMIQHLKVNFIHLVFGSM